jgi:hypothetical protein
LQEDAFPETYIALILPVTVALKMFMEKNDVPGILILPCRMALLFM